MTADQHVTNVVDHTAKLQSTRLSADAVKTERVFVWNEIAGIADKEHVSNVRLKHSRHYHSTVHAWKHHRFRLHNKMPLLHTTAI